LTFNKIDRDRMAGIRVREADAADAPAMAQICMHSFAPSPIARGLHGATGYSEQGRASMQTTMEKDLNAHTDTAVRYVVAMSMQQDAAPKMVGVAKWHFFDSVLPAEASEGSDRETASSLADAFFGGCHELRQRHIRRHGGAHCILSILAVDPAAQGRGIGSALLNWGMDVADREGVDCWLTSTPVGYGVYRRLGFVDVDVMDLDLRRWAVGRSGSEDWGRGLADDVAAGELADGWYRAVLMRRAAGQAQG
jgi:GNAT superfamily N-acetyltransferase